MLVETQGDITILAPRNSIDVSTSPELEKVALEHLAAGANKLVIDFSQVDYISSAGLRVVLIAAKQLRKSAGILVLSGLSDVVQEVFEISGLTRVLTIAPDINAAKALMN
ncbi:MAG: STAS domain-containing protein [Thiolinea sp.]